MAPLATNLTGVIFIDYTANGRQHTIQFRYVEDGSPDSNTIESIDNLLIDFNQYMPTDWAFLGWRYRTRGGIVSIPLAGAPTPFAGTGTPRLRDAPVFISFVGRSVQGRRNRLTLLGSVFAPDLQVGTFSDYRVTPADYADLDDTINLVRTACPVAIDNSLCLWSDYANIGYNSYWQRKLR